MQRMWVDKYIPAKLYGFVQDGEGHRAFFHMGSFDPGPIQEPPLSCCSHPLCEAGPAPPIVGEEVDVEVDFLAGDEKQAPRATRVLRVGKVTVVRGKVDTFEPNRGWGFVVGEDGISYYLHRSEVRGGSLPLVGSEVAFFAGSRQGRPKACHVTVCKR